MLISDKPVLVVVDASVAVTGALVSAVRQAELLAGDVRTILVLPRGHQVPASRLTAFAEVIELPIEPLRRSLPSLLTYPFALIVGSVQLHRALRQRQATRVQLNDFYFLHGALLRLLGFRGRIVTFVRIDPARFGLAGRIWLAAARRSSDEIAAVSRFIQTRLGPDQPGRLVYEAVVPDAPVSAKPRRAPLFLFVGNIIAGKGQEHAVAAFHRIAERHPDARLRFVGGDMGLARNRAFRARLEQAAAKGPGADRIAFHSPNDDLSGHYGEAFAALNFSASESFSMTCLEASAAALPVIATRCGGPEEIVVNGRTGFLVRVGDVAAMADRIDWLLAHPDEATAMGKEGRMLVAARFSPEVALRAFREMFAL